MVEINNINNNMEKKVIASRVQTPDGTILWSRSVHDFVRYTDTKSGEDYSLDGGTCYQHCYVNKIPAKNISILNTAKWKTLRDFVTRYTPLRDENGNTTNVCEYIRFSHMSDEHLSALADWLKDHDYHTGDVAKYVKREQKYRRENGISIPEHVYVYGIDTAPAIETKDKVFYRCKFV